MSYLPDDRQIYVSGRLWHEIYPKVNLSPFIHALHEGIDLRKYGEGLHKFYFNFLIVLPKSKVLDSYKYYSRKHQEADISVRIPYNQMLNASEEEAIKLMEQAYLRGIDQLKTFSLKNTFDVDGLKKDVQAIFAKGKWYEMAVAA
ncbi:hypothetical protein [Haliscomenobacter sp.]|uniref:hypothetical protein n=1 Tax=Haliscomenobacter sp. TaxID=2717303 RepID=UPI003364CF18